MRVVHTEQLIGRLDELQAVRGAFKPAPEGRVVAVAGEAGIGKTRLLAELCSRATDEGHLVLEGRAAEYEQELPFAMFIDALDPYVATLGQKLRVGLGPETMAELAHVLPSLAVEGAEGALQDERYRAHHAVRALLSWLAVNHRVVLALDDLHWADPASQELILHLITRGPGRDVTLLTAFRTGRPPGPITRAVAAAAQNGLALSFELGPLSQEQVDAWIGDRLDATGRREVYRLSGGNPFYVEQLLRDRLAGVAEPTRPRAVSDGVPVPGAVRDAIEAELARLHLSTLSVLMGAAVAGDPFEPDVAARAADVSESAALEAIDTLLERRLVLLTDVPRRFRFRHPIVRQAVYEMAGGGWRIGAHQRAAEVLASRGASASARAHHVERAAAPGDLRAVALLSAAAEEARGRAPATAAHWLEAADRLLPAGESEQRLWLRVGRAMNLASAGQFDQSRVAIDDALALVEPSLIALRTQLIVLGATVDHLIGRHAAAYASLRAAHDELPESTTAEAARLEVELAVDRLYAAEWDSALDWSVRSYVIAEGLGDTLAVTAAAGLVGCCEAATGVTPSASRLDEGGRLLDSISDAELAQRCEAAYHVAYSENFYHDFERALPHFRRGLAVSRATGQGHVVLPLTIGVAMTLERLGRLDEALEAAHSAIEACRIANNNQWLCWALSVSARILAQQGDFARALPAGEEAVAVARAHDCLLVVAAVGWAVGAALLEAGELERCQDVVLSTAGGPDIPMLPETYRPWHYEVLLRADIGLGRLDRAADWAARLSEHAQRLQMPAMTAIAHRAAALLALAEGDVPVAVSRARDAVARFDETSMAVERGRARLVLGRALAAAGDDRAAVAELRRSERQLASLGAETFRREAAAALRSLGSRASERPTARASSNGDGLTPRQIEIARLVALGRSNREIAAALFLSEKTVENHLARAFAKLGVSSRAALAAAVTREQAQLPGSDVR
jgi:DNA-binding NarL/FixJ family response regulator